MVGVESLITSFSEWIEKPHIPLSGDFYMLDKRKEHFIVYIMSLVSSLKMIWLFLEHCSIRTGSYIQHPYLAKIKPGHCISVPTDERHETIAMVEDICKPLSCDHMFLGYQGSVYLARDNSLQSKLQDDSRATFYRIYR